MWPLETRVTCNGIITLLLPGSQPQEEYAAHPQDAFL